MEERYLLKVIGSAFSKTARQSVSIMRYLEGNGFPVPKTILTKVGDAVLETEIEGEKKLSWRSSQREPVAES